MNAHCLFIDIIGSMPDENENTDKIGGYYQVTNGILIKDLVIKLLNMKKEQIKIFAYGDKLFYDPYIHTNNKYYYQFGLHDIFQMTADPHDLEFKYFFDFKKTLQDIDRIIKKGKYTSIILFLDDHGSKGKFSNMNYFQLYQIFLKYPEISFLIFNDSCFSGSLINLIETYKKIYELKIENKINDEICLQLVFSFTNLFKSIMKKKNINDPINEVKNLIEFYQTNEITDQNKFKDLLNVIKSNSNSIDKIKKIGFQSTEEITNFQIIYHSLHLKENLEEDTDAEFIKYTKSREVFSTTNLNLIINLFNDDLQEFVNVIDILDACKENINFQYQPSKNVEIITSTDDKSKCFSYTSIRTNNVTKVLPGSPAMSEFIKGIFLSYDKSIINFDTIKKAMCGTDEKTIYYSVRVREKSSKGHIKKEWANLFPQHYKSNDTNSFSLKIPEKSGQKIAALRAISFIISNKSTEIAKKLSPDSDPKVHNIFNDPIADMVAIAAIINENSNMNEIINNSINENQFYKEHEIFGFDLISPIIEFASYSSRDKLQMIAVMMNCLSAAIIKEINQSIKSIEVNDELKIPILKFILKNEISYFQSNLNEINNVNNDKDNHCNKDNDINKSKIIKEYNKIEVINEVKNAIFALLQPSSIFFVYIIASSLLDDINIEGIKQSDFITSSSKMNKYYKQFLENENLNQLKEIKFRKLAEHCLFNHVKLSLDSLNDICDMHIKNDIMKVVVRGIQSQNSIFLVKMLVENIEGDSYSLFIDNIIKPIEEIISSNKISSFYIPAIIEFLPPNEIIYALYASLTYIQDNWFDNLINILKSVLKKIASSSMNYQYIDEDSFLQLAFDALKKQQNILEKSVYEAEVERIKDNYIKEVNQSIKKVIKLVEISVKRVRGNISRMMNMEILENRLDYCYDFCNQIEENDYKNKFHDYLYSSISEFVENVNEYMNKAHIDDNIKEEFDNIEHLKNADDLYKRAAIELNTIAHIFSISDDSLYQSNKNLSKIIDSDQISLQVSSIFARALNIVEMSPVSYLLDSYSTKFTQTDIIKPNIKELMGLLGANIYILTPKDEMRSRTKVDQMKKITKKDNDGKVERYFECEYDSYYSDNDDDFVDIPYRPTQVKSQNGSSKISNDIPKRLWHKDQMSQIIIGNIQKKLQIGRSDWTYDAWIAFIYCFNERMKNIKLQFNLNDEYENDIYYFNIDDAKSIIDSFYPLYRITDFWINEYKIQLFIGKNKNHAKEILRAMIRGFDDADRIVTPIHMFRETYEERTSPILKRIFNF